MNHIDTTFADLPQTVRPAAAVRFPSGSAAELLTLLATHNAEQVRKHAFVRRCAAGNATMAELKVFLAQHGLYGGHFVRNLCALIGNLEHADDVARLTHNLAEEIGADAPDGESHAALYRRMLAGFDIDTARAAPLPGTRMLSETMAALCRRRRPIYGLAALYLGAEAIVPGLYGDIMAGLLARGAPAGQLAYFRIHIDGDDSHAAVMHAILARRLEEDPSAIDAVYLASSRAIQARMNFFTNIEWEAS